MSLQDQAVTDFQQFHIVLLRKQPAAPSQHLRAPCKRGAFLRLNRDWNPQSQLCVPALLWCCVTVVGFDPHSVIPDVYEEVLVGPTLRVVTRQELQG